MKKEIYIGQLDRKINIYETTEVKNSNGEVLKTESLYKSVWAGMVDINSSEAEDGKIYLVQIRDYTIRYDEKIFQTGEIMFIRVSDGDYFIKGIKTIGRKQYLTLKTVKRE